MFVPLKLPLTFYAHTGKIPDKLTCVINFIKRLFSMYFEGKNIFLLMAFVSIQTNDNEYKVGETKMNHSKMHLAIF